MLKFLQINQTAVYLKFLYKISCLLLSVGFLSCTQSISTTELNTPSEVKLDTTIKYAKRFAVANGANFKELILFGKKDSHDTSSVFVLYQKDKPHLSLKNAYYIQVPVKNIASLSSIYCAMLAELNLTDKISAIESVDYYNNQNIVEGVKSGRIKEIAKGPELNVEQTLMLHPDLILMFGMGDPRQDVNLKILNSNIPVAISLDHLEEHPLARAEWIKFIAAFFEKERLADSLFNITEKNYNYLKQICDTVKFKPTVLTEIRYADAWYVPGGKSFMSHLLNDAGATYIWRNNEKTGSLPLSFEQVYTEAKDADFWLNLFINVHSKKDLLSFDERYNLFSAFKNDKLYNNNLHVNNNGFSDYWETGMAKPDELLKDIIKIFHPNLLPEYQLKYYKKIN